MDRPSKGQVEEHRQMAGDALPSQCLVEPVPYNAASLGTGDDSRCEETRSPVVLLLAHGPTAVAVFAHRGQS